jgi:hypothetical protein
MASITPGLPLPMELVVHIVKHCEEYDSPNDSYVGFLVPQSRGVYGHVALEERKTWTTISWSTKRDIINIRSVCKQLKDASFQSFGKILGDRKFRLTKAGLQDLRDIGEVKQLVPWIKTLTFGSAQLRNPQDYLNQKPTADRQVQAIEKLYSKYMAEEEEKEPEKILLQVLAVFRKLEGVRIILSDKTKYLGGWLSPEQQNVVESWDESYYKLARFYTSEDSAPSTVLRTLETAGIIVKDLRLALGGFLWPHLLPKSLRVLRITHHLGGFIKEYDDEIQPLLYALKSMTSLEELDIMLLLNLEEIPDYRYESGLEYLAQNLFKAIKKTPNLRRIALEGDWILDKASLCNFVIEHAFSLRQLIFWRCVLDGSWLQVFRAIAEITQDKLEYLSVMYVRYAAPGGFIEDENFEESLINQLPQFSCITDFRGFPMHTSESSEDESWDDDSDSDVLFLTSKTTVTDFMYGGEESSEDGRKSDGSEDGDSDGLHSNHAHGMDAEVDQV